MSPEEWTKVHVKEICTKQRRESFHFKGSHMNSKFCMIPMVGGKSQNIKKSEESRMYVHVALELLSVPNNTSLPNNSIWKHSIWRIQSEMVRFPWQQDTSSSLANRILLPHGRRRTVVVAAAAMAAAISQRPCLNSKPMLCEVHNYWCPCVTVGCLLRAATSVSSNKLACGRIRAMPLV